MITWMPHIRSLAVARSLNDDDLYEAVHAATSILQLVEQRPAPSAENEWLPSQMWVGFEYALCLHGLMLATELVSQRHLAVDEVPGAYLSKIGTELENIGSTNRSMPPWVGDLDVHRSHRSQLIAQTPDYTEKWPATPVAMPILWPQIVDNSPRGYRLRLSTSDLRKMRHGTRRLPAWLRYSESSREVVSADGEQ